MSKSAIYTVNTAAPTVAVNNIIPLGNTVRRFYAAMAYKLISGRTSTERLEPLKVQGDSEFLRTAGGKDPVKVLAVMDELMGAVAALNKNLYEATIEKIKAV